MYHEERIINGVVYCRCSPNEEFRPCAHQALPTLAKHAGLTVMTREQVKEVKQVVVEEIGYFERPADEIRHPLVAALRDMIVTGEALWVRIEELEKEVERLEDEKLYNTNNRVG